MKFSTLSSLIIKSHKCFGCIEYGAVFGFSWDSCGATCLTAGLSTQHQVKSPLALDPETFPLGTLFRLTTMISSS